MWRSHQSFSPAGSRSEAISIAALFVAFLAINFATASRFPTVYIDEVTYTDPAANLYFGHGFTSSAWFAQTKDEFWAAHGPLYSALLYVWMLPFGFSPLAVRSLNYVLMVISMLMLWLAVIRLNLVPSAWKRITLVALLLSSYGLTFNYRTGRLDCVAIMLCTASVLVYSIRPARIRYPLFLCIGILIPMAGLQTVLYAAIVCGLLLIYLGKSFLRESTSLAVGVIVGAIFLYSLYSLNGVVDGFLATLGYFTRKDHFVSRSLSEDIRIAFPFTLAKDISFPFLLASAFAVTAYQINKSRFKLRSPLSFGLAVSLCVPLGLGMIGHYPAYYGWMAFIPLSVCVFSAMAGLDDGKGNHFFIRAATGFLLVAGVIGLPLHLALAAYDWNDRDYAPVERLAERNVTKEDWILCDYGAYYAVKKRAAVAFLPQYLYVIPPQETERISTLIIGPGSLEQVKRTLGGEWYDTGDGISPEVEGLFGFPIRVGLLTLPKYKLRVFRRAKTSEQAHILSRGPTPSSTK
jgi:hypothetical protein